MTEADWWVASKPNLQFVEGKVSDRKMRLFTVACCHRIRFLFPSDECRKFVEVLELYADGLASADEVDVAADDAWDSDADPYYPFGILVSSFARTVVRHAQDTNDGWNAAAGAIDWFRLAAREAGSSNFLEEDAAQAQLLRDICGPTLFRPVQINLSWLSWRDGLVAKLARSIYVERAFDRLPVLGDALEVAGCTNADILTHLRCDGTHVRGCWPVDLILGKS